MSVSTIFVYHSDGSPAVGKKVALSFLRGGMSAAGRTDRRGQGFISHEASGSARVYVDGRNMGIMDAPGRFSVRL